MRVRILKRCFVNSTLHEPGAEVTIAPEKFSAAIMLNLSAPVVDEVVELEAQPEPVKNGKGKGKGKDAKNGKDKTPETPADTEVI